MNNRWLNPNRLAVRRRSVANRDFEAAARRSRDEAEREHRLVEANLLAAANTLGVETRRQLAEMVVLQIHVFTYEIDFLQVSNDAKNVNRIATYD